MEESKLKCLLSISRIISYVLSYIQLLKATYTVVYKESTLVYDILFIYILYAKPWGKITLMT